mgnify:CR=1 FL=1
MYLSEFIPLAPTCDQFVLLASASIPAGEPANVCTEFERFNLQEHITGGRSEVYTVRAIGDSMETEIRNGDLLVVNRNLLPKSGDIVIASVNGAYTVKVFQRKQSGLYLVPKNDNYEPQIITRKDDFEVFGVVTFIVHKVKNF